MPYKKGQSGNLRGRPKENYEVKQLAREYTREAIQRLVVWMRSNNPKASVSAANALLDRGHGRPAMSGPDQGSPAKVVHEVIWSGSSEGDTSSTMVNVSRSYPSIVDINAGRSSLPIAAPARRLQRSTTKSGAR